MRFVVMLFVIVVAFSWGVSLFVLLLNRLSRMMNPDYYRDESRSQPPANEPIDIRRHKN